jgi:uncharacterized protein DUF4397
MRLLKSVSVICALAALIFVTISCGSSGGTQLRVVNALSNNPNNNPLDIYVNNALINSTALSYSNVFPSQPNSGPATYTGVPGGSISIGVYNSPQATSPPTDPIFPPVTETLTGGDQYTLVLAGSLHSPAPNEPTAYLFTDTNIAPASGNIVLHIIDASVNTPVGGFSIYIYQTSGGIPSSPQITGLTLGKLVTYSPAWVANTSYAVTVAYPTGAQFYTYFLPSPNNQQITTLVIQDVQSGYPVESQPIVMTDLN